MEVITTDTNLPMDPRKSSSRVMPTQIGLALSLGTVAFITFCILRPRWKSIYGARLFTQKSLPKLKSSMFDWLPQFFRMNDNHILEYSGLDAFVFLGFFKMSIKLMTLFLFFAATIISPVRYYFTGDYDYDHDPEYNVTLTTTAISTVSTISTIGSNSPGLMGVDILTTDSSLSPSVSPSVFNSVINDVIDNINNSINNNNNNNCIHNAIGNTDGIVNAIINSNEEYPAYLWMYAVFVYVFTLLTLYMLFDQTRTVIRVRHEYLGFQNAITDRTVRISGIPNKLRNPDALKSHLASIGITCIETISICYNYNFLDSLLLERKKLLSLLETQYYLFAKKCPSLNIYNPPSRTISPPITLSRTNQQKYNFPTNPDDSFDSIGPSNSLINNTQNNNPVINNNNDTLSETDTLLLPLSSNDRPTIKLGFLGLFGRKVDSIEYYEEKLTSLDERIQSVRTSNNSPTANAFLTFSNVAAAQMTAQTLLDPTPRRLVAHMAPAPSDILWRNIYRTWYDRLLRKWLITVIISVFTIVWLIPISYLSAFLDQQYINKVWPALGKLLNNSKTANLFITGILPPLLFTIFGAIVPYLYDYLSSKQGFLSSDDVELSTIDKNYFFLFFNLFIVFTIAGNVWATLKDTTAFAPRLANYLRQSALFYGDLIILQGIGLFPVRLLELGTVLRYPFLKLISRTKREISDLSTPPIFNYGLVLPQPILVLVICIMYSVMSTKILACGLAYFVIGYYTYKYQLLYAMEHPQHSSGRAWPGIFYRVCVGLLFFQLTMVGVLALQRAYFLATIISPVPIITCAMMFSFYHAFSPLCHFLALRSIQNQRLRPRSSSMTLDEERELHQQYVNPNMTCELEKPMI